jgi:hypothetical protein
MPRKLADWETYERASVKREAFSKVDYLFSGEILADSASLTRPSCGA